MQYKDRALDILKNHNSPIFVITCLAVYSVLLCYVYPPYWQTNDDPTLLMIAHGIGWIAEGDPRFIYSSIFWGGIVQALHTNIIAGYTIATYATVAASVAGIIFCLSRVMRHYFLLTIPFFIIVLIVPLLWPQFTMTASLATMAAVLCALSYVSFRKNRFLIASFVFALLGFWIRADAFFMICLFSLPLFPWKSILRDYTLLACAVAFSLLAGGSVIANHVAYTSEPAWKAFYEWNKVRATFSGYRVSEEILGNPDIHLSHGFSRNDIMMMQYFFFADPKMTDPVAVQSMKDMAKNHTAPTKWSDAYAGVSYFWKESLLKYFSLATLLVLMCFWTRSAFACYLLTFIAFFYISYDGHPPTYRVHASALFFLGVAALFASRGKPTDIRAIMAKFHLRDDFSKYSTAIACIALLLFCFAGGKLFLKTTKANAKQTKTYEALQPINQYIRNTAPNKILISRADYPFENIYRPFNAFSSYSSTRYVWLSTGTSAPFMYTYGDTSPEWFLKIMKEPRVTFVASDIFIDMLDIWAQERMNRRLIVLERKSFELASRGPCVIYTVTTEPINSTDNS